MRGKIDESKHKIAFSVCNILKIDYQAFLKTQMSPEDDPKMQGQLAEIGKAID